MWAPTPARIYEAAAARAAARLPWGWTRPPPRPILPWRVVRGMMRCDSDVCRGFSYRHRDGDAALLLLRNELHKEAHGGEPLHFLRHVRHAEEPPARFYLLEPGP